MKDDPLEDCPHCEAKKSLKRIITPAGGFRIGGMGVHKPTSYPGSQG